MLVVQAYIISPEKINIFRFKWEDQISYQKWLKSIIASSSKAVL